MAIADAVQQIAGGAGAIPIQFVALALVGVLYAVYTRVLLPQPIPGIPYHKKSVKKLLGDGPDMVREVGVSRQLNYWLAEQVHKLQAPLCQVFLEPFHKPWLLLADSIEAQDVLMRRPEFDRSGVIIDGLAPMDGFHARFKTGQTWKTTRSWLVDLIAPTFLNNTISPIMHKNALELMDLWELKSGLANDRPFDVNVELGNSALDGMLHFIFDESFDQWALKPQFDAASKLSKVEVGPDGEAIFPHGQADEFNAAIYETIEAIDKVTKAMSPRFAMWCIRQTRRWKEISALKTSVVRDQAQRALKRYNETGETKTAIEHMMMREQKSAEKAGRKPDYENQLMFDEISGHFIAGMHTTSTALAWTLIYMTKYPQLQDKLRSALHETWADAHKENRVPSLDEMTKTRVPYLEAVLEETLRLHATSVARQANCDTELFGHRIPKGTNIVVVAQGPGFTEPSFKVDPKTRNSSAKLTNNWDETRPMGVFDPERWLVYKEGQEVDFDANAAPQLAFGMGPRSCWGRRFAMLELRMVIAMTIWNFDLLEVSPKLAEPKASYGIVHRADQCFVRLKSRNARAKA